MMRHVVSFSGGVGSWAAAQRVASQHGTTELVLLFADTLMEDSDLYRFLLESAAHIYGVSLSAALSKDAKGIPEYHLAPDDRSAALLNLRAQAADALPGLVWLAEGRTPWKVFREKRMLGNSQFDPCSRILKRARIDRWLTANCDPDETVVYVGIDWSELHRFRGRGDKPGLRERKAAEGWHYEAPLCHPPYLSRGDLFDQLLRTGINMPRLYSYGFTHNNCGGFCVKAGQGHFAHLLRTLPDRYAFHEEKEQEMRDYLDRDVSVLSDRRGDGKKKPLTLRMLRERVETQQPIDLFDLGGCGCALDD